jgi:hypothetical protein
MSNHMIRSSVVTSAAVLALSGALQGCAYDEGLIIHNMRGTIVVPKAAATRYLLDADGVEQEVIDARNIGPVYIGLFPSVFGPRVIDSFPHPEVGPVYKADVQGDTYPYGGTTIGDLRFGCFDSLSCKMVSGRYLDFEQIVDWFTNTLQSPIVDAEGRPVDNGEYFRQTCFDLLEVTADEEIRLTVTADLNGDEKIDAGDLDFHQNSDGDFEAEFIMWQQDYYWDQNAENCIPGADCPGFSVWAFMDAPSSSDASYSTCDAIDAGYQVNEYNTEFFAGRVQNDVLNNPSAYVGSGDWVSDSFEKDNGDREVGHYRWDNIYDQPTIILGHEVQ